MSEFKINPFDMPDENFYPKRISYSKLNFSYEDAKKETLKRKEILGFKDFIEDHTTMEWAWKLGVNNGIN
jgi:hypothetical protein